MSETHDPLRQQPGTRRSFLRKSAVVTSVATAGAVALAGTARAEVGSVRLLARNFRSIQQHENSHVEFLVNGLGSAAFPKPVFRGLTQKTFRAFAILARTFENTGVGAYLGAAPLISSRTVLAQAASIATVEARHSGYLNTLLDQPITQGNEDFETPFTPQEVAQGVAPFLVNPTPVVALANAIQSTPSGDNDIAILRFALALEYLEAEFYNLNVPRLFRGR